MYHLYFLILRLVANPHGVPDQTDKAWVEENVRLRLHVNEAVVPALSVRQAARIDITPNRTQREGLGLGLRRMKLAALFGRHYFVSIEEELDIIRQGER